jgi:hypothetical protein
MAGTDLVPIDSEKMHRDQARVEAGFWDKLRRTIPRIPFLDEAVAAYYCATDPATPLKAKAILYGALAYFSCPSTSCRISFFGWASPTMPPCSTRRSGPCAAT